MKKRPAWQQQPTFDFSAAPEPQQPPPNEPPPKEPPVQLAAEHVPKAAPMSHAARLKAKQGGLTLFDFTQTDVDAEPPSIPAVAEAAPTPPAIPQLASGMVAKARDILAAIRTLKRIELENRPATPDEKQALARFGGFGPVALHLFPDPVTGQHKDASWHTLGEELRELLTVEEYDSAKRTTFNAYYTSEVVMGAMHEGLKRLGTPADALVLEPGCGVARFMSAAPPEMRFIGVELDSLSARIAKALHPNQDIRHENFRDSKLPSVDAVIGNVPFADIKLDWKGQRFSLHDYFFAKATDSLKPGGVLALVTSHFTLDKQNAAIRELLADQADFLGAVRLPSDAFKKEGTAVVTDIVFLRKRAKGQEPNHVDERWLGVGTLDLDGAEVAVNRYFLNHPEMVLGNWSRKDTLYGEGYSIVGDGDLNGPLRRAILRLPEAAKAAPVPVAIAEKPAPRFIPPPPLKHLAEGSFFVNDDRAVCQIVDGRGEPVTYGGSLLLAGGALTGKRLAHLVELRDHARRVLQSPNEDWPEPNRVQARRDLNWSYERFAAAYGPINKTTFSETKDGTQIRRMPNLVKFREDPDAMLVMSLEEYDEATGKAEKAAIMKKDVVGKTPPVTHVSSAEEGLLVSLNQRGQIDLPFIASLYGKPETQIIAELGSLIYLDPESKAWQTADAYLSGNVRAKLVQADAAGPEFARNAEALRQVQPEDVLPGDIDANLGAPWIPESDIQAFAAELFGVPASFIPVAHVKKDALWTVSPNYSAQQSVPATVDYGTPRANGITLFEHALNMKTAVVYDPDPDDDKRRVVNPTETLAAKEKQKLIKEKFRSWVFAEPERCERLVRIYTDAFNNLRPRLFDGSHLTFPDMNPNIKLNPHQTAAIWRCMTAGNTLLAHTVGSGKSFEIAAAAMKMRQTGLVKKCLITIPNHLLEQAGREFMQLYPNAKLLIASKEDFTREKRKTLTAKIASGAWDAVIATHSSFERIGMSQEYQEKFLREQIQEYEQLIVENAGHKQTGAGRNILKSLEKQKANREEKLKDLLAEEKKDSGLVFDDLGVDQLFVDECFTYDTQIVTDQGPLAIGDIVSKNLTVRVKSVNPSTHAVEWKPVVNWFANKRRHLLIEVVHEKGSIRCTTSHKLFTGILTCRKAGEIEAGETLLLLQRDVSPELPNRHPQLAEVLLGDLSHQGHDPHNDLRVVQDRFLLSYAEAGQPCEAPSTVLLGELQDEGSAFRPDFRGEVAECDASCLGRADQVMERKAVTAERCKEARPGRKDEGAACFGRNATEVITRSQSDKPQAISPGREWQALNPASASHEQYRNAAGIGHQHEANPTFNGAIAEALQGGPGGRKPAACGGSGRVLAQFTEGPGAGCEEGQSLVPSRVVRTTLLEPDGDGEYRFGDRSHSVVYDIEVADNHNYFANGVLVSNCQAYKNLDTPTKMERVAGIQTGGSERAFDLYMKARYLDEQHKGHGLVGASGTPISNSMVEMYTMQRYFDPAGLASRGIEHFDAWAATFGEVVESMEISPDGKSLRPRSRFAKFVNLPELQQMFRSFADVQTAEMLNLPRPALAGGKPLTIACPMSREQSSIQLELVERYERLRSQKVDPREDNALAITTDGRKLALDARMLEADAPDHPGSKINALVGNVLRIWKEAAPTRGTQMIFCDMGVHPTPWGFSAYEEITRKLIGHGIPASQIASVGDADTDAKKQVLFEKVRQGSVRVLLGSTQKMGTGTNVQKRLVALHHLDAPWKPAEVEQRDGRILRQGNENPEVSIFRYVTEGSFDAYMWQALETKARFIAQVVTDDNTARKAEDIGGQELSYAEVKAIASGNPTVLTLAEADAELQRLNILKKNHSDEQFLARRSIRELPGTVTRLTQRMNNFAADCATIEANADAPVVIGSREVDRDEVLDALRKRLDAMPENVSDTRHIPLGKVRGIDFGIVLFSHFGPELYLDGKSHRQDRLSRDHRGPRAVLNAVERMMDAYPDLREQARTELAVAESQLQDFHTRIGSAFAHEAYRDELTTLRDQLKLGLSGALKEGDPSVAELAERIKALKASQTIETATPRTAARKVSAEEPVTARIKRQREEAPSTLMEPTEIVPALGDGKERSA